MQGFSTGLSALNTSQRALDIIGQNIANAGTPGYHRQVARLATRLPTEVAGLSIGTGVKITDVARLRNGLLESAITRQQSELSDTTAQLAAMRRIESLLNGADGSVHDRLEAFFNQLEQLSARPDDSTLRKAVLGGAVALTDQLNSLAGEFGELRSGLDAQINGVVGEICPIAQQIAELNAEIQRSEVRGIDANDQRDQRDQLVNELADRAGIRVIEQDFGQVTVLMGGAALVVGSQAAALTSTTEAQGNVVVTLAGSNEPLEISGGTLGGLLHVRNKSILAFEADLNTIATELIGRLDAIHATGIGLGGPMAVLAGQRAARNVAAPLTGADLVFPPTAGSLFVTVTDLATGQRTMHDVSIDPQTQSLSDVAAAISAVANIQAIADAQTGTLRIFAANGFAFDFAGRLEPSPDTAGISGSTSPTIGGAYFGAKNDTYTFEFLGSGTIGVTPDLTLEVRNSAGAVVASLNVGQGYEPGSALMVADGVSISLASGTANAGDTFLERVIAESDTAGILTALGLNTFFTGHDASDIRVRGELVTNPGLLAASATGQPGDGSILRRMAAVRDLPVLENSTRTLSQAYVAMVGDVGQQVQALDQRQTNQSSLSQSLAAQQQSVSGVDPNEEPLSCIASFDRANDMDIRVTPQGTIGRSIAAASRHSARLSELQEQISTGRKLLRPSDRLECERLGAAGRRRDSIEGPRDRSRRGTIGK
jgi:flagellar hook-associated protein FlgK